MNLLIDLGNSRLKWALADGERWQSAAQPLRGRAPQEVLDQAWGRQPAPRRVLACTVSAPAWRASLEDWVRGRWQRPVEFVAAQHEQLGVKNRYRTPRQLGADRWMALVAVRAMTRSAACVIDCGTALTVDALTAGGEFAGGVIFPGLALLRDSLRQGTAAIEDIDGRDDHCLARSTADAVAAGTLTGLIGAVERIVAAQERELGAAFELYLTGGDAPLVSKSIARKHSVEPDLVLKGLARVAREGEP